MIGSSSPRRLVFFSIGPAAGALVVALLLHHLSGAPARAAAFAALARTGTHRIQPLPQGSDPAPVAGALFSEGKVSEVTLTAGPFDLHRKYRSMEGPWIHSEFRVADLLTSHAVTLPESMVAYVEDGGAAPSMMGGGPVSKGQPLGVVKDKNPKRELYWFKGIKLEVLDENDNLLPTAEFICHFNLDINCDQHKACFPEAEPCTNPRLASISQGMTQIYMPEGFAYPVASDETWGFNFQAANRTSLKHRRIKHRCTVYFVRDLDLWYPLTPLNFFVPYMSVVVDRNSPDAKHARPQGLPEL